MALADQATSYASGVSAARITDRHITDQLPPGTPKPAPFFRWREQWCVGIEILDRDHRALTRMIDYMAQRFGAWHGPKTDDAPAPERMSAPASALQFWLTALHERARNAFAREDALMRAAHYPNTAEHTREHALLLAEYTQMSRDIAGRGQERLELADLEAMKQWFMAHMLDMDRHLGGYLREQGITALCPRN
jgi:hemerythrin